MIIIVDANILISAIIKPESDIAEILLTFYNKIDFVVPEYALQEIKKHQNEICIEYGISPASFNAMLIKLTKGLLIFSQNILDNDALQKAETIALPVDVNDALYVAFSISLDALIWTGDRKLYRGLKRRGFRNIIDTKELKQIIKGL